MSLLFLALIGVGAYFLFFSKHRPNVSLPDSKSAEERLKERFVNGEIDEETYRKMKETIGK